MVPNQGSIIWEPPTGTVVLATMVVVDEVHDENEKVQETRQTQEGRSRTGYRHGASHDVPRGTLFVRRRFRA